MKHLQRPPALARGVRLLAAAIALAASFPALAQRYPERPVRVINPFPAGGSGDIVARTVYEKVGAALGQSFVVESRVGAAGAIGTDYVAKAPPDGYTLSHGTSSTFVVNPNVQKNLPYDPVKDFTPIAMLVTAPYLLLVHPSVPVTTLPELVKHAKANAGKLNYGSFGQGSSNHLAYELLRAATGIEMAHVAYKGGAPLLNGLLANEVQSSLDLAATVMPHVKGGKLKLLGIASAKRSALLPETPTLTEQGYRVEAATFFAALGPAKLPPPIVTTLNREINRALALPDVRERLLQNGTEVVGGSPEQLASIIAAELKKWGTLVRERKLTLD